MKKNIRVSLIHKSALVSKSAKLGKGVSIGPGSIIKDNVTIKDNTQVGAYCVIEGNTVIGANCKIFTGAIIGSSPQDLKYKGEKSFVEIKDNNIFREYVTVNPGTGEGSKTIIGSGNLFMAYSHVAHDCIVGSDCVIANNGTLAGHVELQDRVVIGGLTAIHQFCRIGKLSIIGGCSKVTQDIPPFSTCDGHPARIYGINAIGLKRAELDTKQIKNIKEAIKILFFSGMSKTNALAAIKNSLSPSNEISFLIDFVQSSQRGLCRAAKQQEELV